MSDLTLPAYIQGALLFEATSVVGGVWKHTLGLPPDAPIWH